LQPQQVVNCSPAIRLHAGPPVETLSRYMHPAAAVILPRSRQARSDTTPTHTACLTVFPACMHSVRKEPLGHSPSWGYSMPAGMGTTIPCGRPLHVRVSRTRLAACQSACTECQAAAGMHTCSSICMLVWQLRKAQVASCTQGQHPWPALTALPVP
jgi:hypothetical protein